MLPVSSLVRGAVVAALQYFLARTLLAEVAARRRAGRIVRGVLFVIGGGLIGCLAFGFFMFALFFHLADMPTWTQPALITGGIGLLATLLLLWEGVRSVRKE